MSDDWEKGYRIDKTLQALRDLMAATKEEAPNLTDDFDHFTVKATGENAGKTLWHLTRGQEGIPNTLKLQVLSTEK